MQVVQERIGRGMDVERGRDQKEQRIGVGEFAPGKITSGSEFAADMMPLNACPVVEALQGKVDVFVGLEFKHGETAFTGDGKNIQHGAIGSRECRDLRIMVRGIEALIDGGEIAQNQRLEPALRLQPPQGLKTRAKILARGA